MKTKQIAVLAAIPTPLAEMVPRIPDWVFAMARDAANAVNRRHRHIALEIRSTIYRHYAEAMKRGDALVKFEPGQKGGDWK